MPANRKQGRLCNCTEKIVFLWDLFILKRGGSNPWKPYVAKFIFWISWKRFQNFTGPFRVTSWLLCCPWLNMELHLQSLFGLHAHSLVTTVLISWDPATPPHPPRIWAHIRGRYWSAKIDDIYLWPPAQNSCLGYSCLNYWKFPFMQEQNEKRSIGFFQLVFL